MNVRGLFILILLLSSGVAQSQRDFTIGIATSNSKLQLKPESRKYEGYFTNPIRPSTIGLELNLMFSQKRFSQGLNLQFFYGQYWYSEKPTYTRYFGQVIYEVDRKAREAGLGLAYVMHYRLHKMSGNKNTFQLMSQSAFDFYRLRYDDVAAPYPGMYSLALHGSEENVFHVRQFLGLRLERSMPSFQFYVYGGAEVYTDFYNNLLRPGYRFGVGISDLFSCKG